MPAKGRKDPTLLQPDGEQGPEISVEEAEANADTAGPEHVEEQLVYDGELLQTSMTLACILPGDSKESYFGSRFVGRCQEGETAEALSSRAITVVRETVLAQIDDAVDALAEFQQELAKRLGQ